VRTPRLAGWALARGRGSGILPLLKEAARVRAILERPDGHGQFVEEFKTEKERSSDMAEEKEGGFKITDRRMFKPDGSLRDDAVMIEPPPPPVEMAPPPPPVVPEPPLAPPSAAAAQEEMDAPWAGDDHLSEEGPAAEHTLFNEFLLQIAQSAFIYLGLVEHPATGRRQVDLRAARETIDILDMLREKTRNNLAPGEEKFFTELLSDLKMQFVARSGR